MANFLIALSILILLGVGVTLVVRKGGTEEERQRARAIAKERRQSDAIADERQRAKAIADATMHRHDHLSDADSAYVAEYSAAAEVWKTDAHPTVGLDDPLQASPLDTYWRLPAVAVEDVPIYRDLLGRMTEPAPLEVEGFTTGWTKTEIADILAQHKAGAR